jgi:hypothetical protein
MIMCKESDSVGHMAVRICGGGLVFRNVADVGCSPHASLGMVPYRTVGVLPNNTKLWQKSNVALHMAK